VKISVELRGAKRVQENEGKEEEEDIERNESTERICRGRKRKGSKTKNREIHRQTCREGQIER
jgi:hypothetical protein